jgi:serine/threonine protein phosphatase PrpC
VNGELHVLLGSEVVTPGAVKTVGGPDVAAACSPGARLTVHSLRDPNEDAALVATGEDGTWLAAVVDGYGTVAGTHAVIDHLVDAVPDLMAAAVPNVGGVVVDALEALAHVRRSGAHATGASVTLAVGRASDVWIWTRGDTAALLVGGGVRAVSGIVPPPSAAVVLPPPRHVVRDPDERLVLVTDGWFDALGDDWHAIAARENGPAHLTAQTHVRAALERGADDAVTVVVVAPPPRGV